MNPIPDKRKCVNDVDRCRLGRMLVGAEPCVWGNRRSRSNLEVILEQSKRLKTRATPEDLVTMNTKVTLSALPEEKRRTVTLVYPDDVDLALHGVSILAPLGLALLGSRIGDVIECAGEKRGRRFRVVDIIYQPEHAGAFQR
jgi:regulator of nucleoside diphosphate kinase